MKPKEQQRPSLSRKESTEQRRLTDTPELSTHGKNGNRGGTQKFQTDPYWKDHLLFYEYFHADNGAGLGASHQTGWTGCIAKLIEMFGRIDAHRFLDAGKSGAFANGEDLATHSVAAD